jgi:hypothetical protein
VSGVSSALDPALISALRDIGAQVVDVRPRGRAAAMAWPANVPDLGPHTIAAFTACADCGVGTWSLYGGVGLCAFCAWIRWRNAHLIAWRSALAAGTP